ncbi:MAG: DUF4065 domain-containing protein [Actinobacteria bacterium]|nr:DUF4065 domain-containing protein [Actinomycetota bacterium]
MGESIFKNPAIIAYLVKRLHEVHPGKQAGKTFVQKMLYLLSREGVVGFNYSMYHYGPYSSGADAELNFAENRGLINIKWVDGAGYFTETTPELDKFEKLIQDNEKSAIDRVIERYGDFNAVDLSLIATAYFMKDNFDTPDTELANAIHNLKPKYTAGYIQNVLEKGGIMAT